MIFVGQQIIKYCQENNLPPSSGKDRCHIGQTVRDRFNVKFLKSADGPIEGTALVKTHEEGRPFIVLGYPDEFLTHMVSVISNFYSEKQKRMDRAAADEKAAAERKAKPPRARIPAKRPAYTGK